MWRRGAETRKRGRRVVECWEDASCKPPKDGPPAPPSQHHLKDLVGAVAPSASPRRGRDKGVGDAFGVGRGRARLQLTGAFFGPGWISLLRAGDWDRDGNGLGHDEDGPSLGCCPLPATRSRAPSGGSGSVVALSRIRALALCQLIRLLCLQLKGLASRLFRGDPVWSPLSLWSSGQRGLFLLCCFLFLFRLGLSSRRVPARWAGLSCRAGWARRCCASASQPVRLVWSDGLCLRDLQRCVLEFADDGRRESSAGGGSGQLSAFPLSPLEGEKNSVLDPAQLPGHS
jgi:hypothetical protein